MKLSINDIKVFFHPELGMALPLVLVFCAALLAFGIALFSYSFNEKLIALYHCQDIRKFYLAESGLEAGLAILQHDFYYQDQVKGFLDDGSFTVNFTDSEADRRIIRAEGRLEEYSLVLKVLVEKCSSGKPVIIEWLGE